MFNFGKTYTYFNEDRIASESGAVVILKTQSSEFKGKKFVAACLMAVSIGVLSLQAGFVLNANADENPITSPVTSEESPSPSDSGSPITSPEVTPTPTPLPAGDSQPANPGNSGGNGNSGNNGGGSSSGGSSPSAPSCDNEAPKAPKIISATSAAKNEITLNWEKAQGNVTHYAISYGLMPGKPLYGNPNIGNVASFTVKGLSAGTTYYFQINAVNGCTGGPASNEIGIKGGGKFINSPAQGFKASGVLGKSTQVRYATKSASGKPALAKPVVFNNANIYSQSNVGLVGKVFNFFKNLF